MTPKLRGLGELVAYAPYLLGFHPRRSVVVVGTIDGGIGPVSRVDVPDDPAHDAAVAEMLADQLERIPLERIDVLGFDDDVRIDALIALVADAVGVSAAHQVVIADGRWRVTACTCGARCPEGVDLPVPSADQIPAVADHVLREVRLYADREDLVRSLEPVRPLLARALMAAADEPVTSAATLATAWAAVLDPSDGATPMEQVSRDMLGVAMRSLLDLSVRDDLIGWMTPGALELSGADPAVARALQRAIGTPPWRRPGRAGELEHDVQVVRLTRRLQQLVTLTPGPWVTGTATLLGYWCWVHGNGALATVALDRAVHAGPPARMAELVLHAISLGVRPQDLRSSPREIAS